MKTLKGLISIIIFTFATAVFARAQTDLTTLAGQHVNVQGQSRKVVILAIGASWLPLSGKQVEYANALAKKYAGKNVVVYFVATDSANSRSKNFATDEAIRKFGADNRVGMTILRDSDGAVTIRKFNIEQVPSFVILDKQGNRVGEPFGGIDPKYDVTVPISKAVDKLL